MAWMWKGRKRADVSDGEEAQLGLYVCNRIEEEILMLWELHQS